MKRLLVPALFSMLAMLAARRPAAAAGTPPGGLEGAAEIASATNCKSCHGGFMTDDGKMYMPWDTWAGSMMANAARDPLYLAAVSVAEQDKPGSGSFCLRCHTPSAWVESRTTPGNGSALNDTDLEGVQCAVCHRSIDGSLPPTSDPMAPYIGNAQLYFDLSPYFTYFGPYDDSSASVHEGMKAMFVGGEDSRMCGQCHQVSNPTENLYDASGKDTGKPFPLDTTYEEWQQSSFASGATAKSCQACHMPAQTGSYAVGAGSGNRDNPARHDFVGGNDWGPALLKAAFPGTRDAQYDYTRAAAQANLKTAARLEIRTLAAEGPAGRKMDLGVRVTNLTGHKFPTGYADGRRAWVEIAVVDSSGAVDVQSGAYDTAGDDLVEDEQLRVYESVQGRDGAPEDHIVLHRQILRDSRIPPAGFHPTPATQIIGPIKFSDGAGGVASYDDATFHVELPNAVGADVTVRVRLVFQAMTAHHVAALAAANTTDDRGTKLMALWQQVKATPLTIAEATQAVHLVAPPPDDGGCGCATSGTGRRASGAVTLLSLIGVALCATRRRRRRPNGD